MTNEPETEVVKRKVAEHDLIDAAGTVVEEEEAATGIRYTLLANQQAFEYQFGKSADADRMLALFGAKTLATNETSQARNSAKGAAGADEQIQAVRDRFALISTGQWVDRTREGVGAKIDKDALTEAIIRVQIAAGAKTLKGEVVTAELAAAGYKATLRQKLEDDATYVRKARQVPAVASEYSAIVGRQVATLDDLGV